MDLPIPKRGKAIFLSHKNISQSPRILKQALWLNELGWEVSTVGLDSDNPLAVATGRHFSIKTPSAMKRYATYLFSQGIRRYRALFASPFAAANLDDLATFDLLIIHDLTPLPFADSLLKRDGLRPKIILDLHENHLVNLGRNVLERIAFDGFRRWLVSQASEIISRRSSNLVIFSVSVPVSKGYERLFGQPTEVLYNSGSYQDLHAKVPNTERIGLVHHGMAASYRGQEALLLALRKLDSRISLTFILVGSKLRILKLRLLANLLGIASRVTFQAPVPPDMLPKELNKHDISVMILPPVTQNQMDALPGKFFDSIQARLAIVTGPNSGMKEIVERFESGIVMSGWKSGQLAKAIESLTSQEVYRMKLNQSEAARHFNAAEDKARFLARIQEKGWL